jgi:hypothetical protein
LRVWNLKLLRAGFHQQQRGFPGAELHILNSAKLAVAIENCAAYQIADIRPTRLQLRPLISRNLQLAMQQSFRVRDRITTGKLQNQVTLMRPKFLDLQLAPGAIFGLSPQLHALAEAVRNIRVQLHRNFAAASLSFQDAGQGNKLGAYSRISSA